MGLLHTIDQFLTLEVSDNLKNKDLVPIPSSRRKWGFMGNFSYWAICSLCPVSWASGSSLLYIGLSGSEAIGAIVIGNVFIAIATLLISEYGAKYHIGFSVYQRLIFGIRGGVFGVLIRAICSVVWFAYQAWLGGLCVNIILSSWSKKYLYMQNTFPESTGMDSQGLVGFVIFLVISVPVLLTPPEYYSKFLALSSFVTLVTGLGIVGWAVHANGGPGSMMKTPLSGMTSPAGWIWIYAINNWYSSLTAGISNQSDYSRFGRDTKRTFWGIFLGCNLTGFITPLMGIYAASAIKEKYGEELWMPTDICMFWLTNDYSATSRAGAFFAGLGLVIAQLGINCVGNCIAGGMDLASIFPRYINIRRGAIICLLLAWPTQPWLFYNTSSTFLTVLSAFSVFVTPLISIYITEYFIVRKRKIKLTHLYINGPQSIYWYNGGFNFRSFISFACGCGPGLPGLITAANPDITIPKGLSYFYWGSFVFQFAITMFVHYALSFVLKPAVAEVDDVDYFDTYFPKELERYNVAPFDGQRFEGEDVSIIEEIEKGAKESE